MFNFGVSATLNKDIIIGFVLNNVKRNSSCSHSRFCADVSSAIDIVELCLEKYGTPLYVRHAIVHNTSIIKNFETKESFFENLDVFQMIKWLFLVPVERPPMCLKRLVSGLHIIDATCPLVTKVHRQARRYSQREVQHSYWASRSSRINWNFWVCK